MGINYDNISRIQINLSIALIRIININVSESLLYTGIKNTKTIKIVLKQTLKSRYSLRRLDYKSPHYQAEIRSIRDLLSDLSSSKNSHIDNYFSYVMSIIKIKIVISIKIAFNLDLKRFIKLTSSTIKIS